MPFRLVGRAEERIDAFLLESARQWGIDAAARYHQLMLAEFANRGDDPTGLVEILSIVHDRMLLPRAARRAQR